MEAVDKLVGRDKFEMVSGFTTTGASVVLNVEELSHCTNMWRCCSHWIGGMVILVLDVYKRQQDFL